jgi:hypothetical protein
MVDETVFDIPVVLPAQRPASTDSSPKKSRLSYRLGTPRALSGRGLLSPRAAAARRALMDAIFSTRRPGSLGRRKSSKVDLPLDESELDAANPLFERPKAPKEEQRSVPVKPDDDFFLDNSEDCPSFYSFFKEAGHIPLEDLLKEIEESKGQPKRATSLPSIGSAFRKARSSVRSFRFGVVPAAEEAE